MIQKKKKNIYIYIYVDEEITLQNDKYDDNIN